MLRVWTCLLLFLFLDNNTYALLPIGGDREKLETEIMAIMEKLHLIGLAVVVVNEGQIVYKESFGYKTIDTDNGRGRELLQNKHLFRIASISKTFVATAILQLEERGKLKLDDDVNRYLKFRVSNPRYPQVPITIKMLLSHRSSINDSQGCGSFNYISPQLGKNYRACYNDYAPGKGYCYSNYNYNLLGAIVESVSRERFDNYIEKNITDLLGLKCSFNVNKLDSTLFVSLYEYDKQTKHFVGRPDVYKTFKDYFNNYKLSLYTPILFPMAGMKITAEDLAKYMIMHMQGGKYKHRRIISQKSEELIRKVVTKESGYALSFREYITLLPGEILIGQTGGSSGLFSAMIFHPEKNYGFVVITNGCISNSIDGYQDLHKSVIRCLFDNLIEKN